MTSIAESATTVQADQAPALPEAAISINAYIHVPGLPERIQVTARGRQALDTAQRLKEGINAIQQTFAPTPPLPSREQRLAILLTCGLQRAVNKDDYRLIERLSKAAALVLAGRVVDTGQAVWEVRSQTEPATTLYEVQGRTCTCPDSHKHEADEQRYYCKHAAAVLFAMKLNAQEQDNVS